MAGRPSWLRPSWLLNRLDPDERRPQIVADPELRRIAPVIDVHAADVRHPGKQVFHGLARPRVDANDAIVVHPAGPGEASLVGDRIVDVGPWRRQRPLLEFLGLRVEHADLVAAE